MWVLVLVVIMIIGFVLIKSFVLKPNVEKMYTGIVVINPSDMGVLPGYPEDSEEGGDCWQCYLDGFVYNPEETGIPWGDITNDYFLDKTNCTNKSMFESVSCPEDETEIGSSCGDGVCDSGEDATSCPADCGVAEVPSNVEPSQGLIGEEVDEILESPELEASDEQSDEVGAGSVEEALAGESYNTCTIGGECVTLAGNGESKCSKDSDCTEEPKLQESPQLSAQESSLKENPILGLLLKLFGLSPS